MKPKYKSYLDYSGPYRNRTNWYWLCGLFLLTLLLGVELALAAENTPSIGDSATRGAKTQQGASSQGLDPHICSLGAVNCPNEAKTVLTTCYTSKESHGANGRNPWSVATRIYPQGTRLWIDGFGEKVVETVHASYLSPRIDIWFSDDYEGCLKYGAQKRNVIILSQ
jgi:3D (Asp-Asp-Asp) domain-containing protein